MLPADGDRIKLGRPEAGEALGDGDAEAEAAPNPRAAAAMAAMASCVPCRDVRAAVGDERVATGRGRLRSRRSPEREGLLPAPRSGVDRPVWLILTAQGCEVHYIRNAVRKRSESQSAAQERWRQGPGMCPGQTAQEPDQCSHASRATGVACVACRGCEYRASTRTNSRTAAAVSLTRFVRLLILVHGIDTLKLVFRRTFCDTQVCTLHGHGMPPRHHTLRPSRSAASASVHSPPPTTRPPLTTPRTHACCRLTAP